MGHILSIDFGTTNSVVARWISESEPAHIVRFDGLSLGRADNRPPLIPSLLYVHDAGKRAFTIGQAVRDGHLDIRRDNRLFRNFKRGIVAAPAADPREIDHLLFSDRDAGREFIRAIMDALPYQADEIDQIVLTTPVASFEGYLSWLGEVVAGFAQEKVRIVDESTAAALGYAVTEPGAVVLVFDFGGGTLDLSLVQLPESREKTGGWLRKLIGRNAGQHTAKVMAKAGKVMGGSDVDQWILADVLRRSGLSAKTPGLNHEALLTACEQAKIALSTDEMSMIRFDVAEREQEIAFSRSELEALLEQNEFLAAVRRVVDKVMHVAHQRGIFKEDIRYVLLVGGMSLMPVVQNLLKQYFKDMAVRSDKPFTAVAEGALQVAAGYGLDDYLAHSYGLRHLENGIHHYDEIIPMGSRYPTEKPIDVLLGAAHEQQQEVEFLVGEIDTDSVSMLEVTYEDGQAVFVAQAGGSEQKIIPVNADQLSATLARLIPPGTAGEDRLRAQFRIDDRRQLRLTVHDLLSDQDLLNDVVLATLH